MTSPRPTDAQLRDWLQQAEEAKDDYAAVIRELLKARAALLEIASQTKWSEIKLDGAGAETGLMIVSEMQRIARTALVGLAAAPPVQEGWREVMTNLLESYLATFGGNKDELALKAEALLATPPVADTTAKE